MSFWPFAFFLLLTVVPPIMIYSEMKLLILFMYVNFRVINDKAGVPFEDEIIVFHRKHESHSDPILLFHIDVKKISKMLLRVFHFLTWKLFCNASLISDSVPLQMLCLWANLLPFSASLDHVLNRSTLFLGLFSSILCDILLKTVLLDIHWLLKFSNNRWLLTIINCSLIQE